MIPNRISLLLKGLKKYPEAVLAIGDWQEINAGGNLTGRKSDFKPRFKMKSKNDISLLLC